MKSCFETHSTAWVSTSSQTAWALGVNEHVQNGYRSLTALLSEMGFHFGTYLWDPQYNGLDDYIWQGCYHRHRPE